MDVKDTVVAGAAVLAVGTSGVVGGNQVMDKVNKGPERRRDATYINRWCYESRSTRQLS